VSERPGAAGGRVLRIAIVSCVYPPEPVVSAKTSSALAGYFVEQGHSVTVITGFPHRPSGMLARGWKRTGIQREAVSDHLSILRCYSTLSASSSLLSRFIENISFGAFSAFGLFRAGDIDVAYVNTWPVFAQLLILLVAKMRGVPIVLSVQDLLPEAIRARPGALMRAAAKCVEIFETLAYAISSHVVFIGNRLLKNVAGRNQFVESKCSVVPNWIPGQVLREASLVGGNRKEFGIADSDFVIVFAGNVNSSANVEIAIEAMSQMGDYPFAKLLIAGDGPHMSKCQELSGRLGGNVMFVTPFPEAETWKVLNLADAFVLTSSTGQNVASVPSKLLYYLVGGRPIVAAIGKCNDVVDVIVGEDCGLVCDAGDAKALCKTFMKLVTSADDELRRMGRNAANAYVRRFSEKKCLQDLENIVCSCAKDNSDGSPVVDRRI